jgi:Ion channel
MTTGGGAQVRIRLVRTEVRKDRYGGVFLLLLATYVVGAAFSGLPQRLTLLVLYALVLLLIVRAARPARRFRRIIRIVLLAGSVVTALAELVWHDGGAEALLLAWFAVVLLVSIVTIVREVLEHPTVTLQTIFGALSAYLLIGFLFAAVYGVTARLDDGTFFAGGQPPVAPSLQYFSFVTLTTTGYGDLTASAGAPQAMAVLEALLGQIFLVTLVARLVALFGQPRPAREPRDSG